MTDPVNHPAHYTEHPSGIECIQITEHMGFNLGNAVKYIWRADLKGSAIEDLEKARWYIDRELTKRDHIDAEVVGADVPDFAPGGVVIPEGGRVLTAEQVEDVRALVWLDGRRNFDAFYRLRALFPATEPAEEAAREGDCALPPAHDGPCNLAPAEPAEEETKAELPTEVGDRIRASVTRWSSALEWPDSNPYIDTFVLSSSGFWDAENDQFTVVPSCFSYIEVLEVLPSPVVPAPTETGPWQRIEDVPEGVGRLTDRDGDVWEWDGDNWITPETAILPTAYINKHYAPFVAAGEGQS